MQISSLKGRLPRITSAMSSRVIYIAAGLAVIGALVIAYGFYFRTKKKEEQRAAFSVQNAAPDAAVGNRKGLHGMTPVSSVQEEPPPQAKVENGVRGVVRTITQPLGPDRGVNCPPLPDGQPGNCVPQQPAYLPPPVPPEDPQVRMRADRARREYERRMAAIDAPTGATTGADNTAAPSKLPDVSPVDVGRLGTVPANAVPAMQAQPPKHQGGSDDPNGQDEKRAFQQAPEGDYLRTTRIAPLSPWVIERGEHMPATLSDQIVSDLPGDLIAEVQREVYDSPQHRYVLIPAGSLLVGDYNSAVTYGQKRAQVIWTYLRFPDGSYVNLDKFTSHSADGAVGLSDQVDNHIKRLVGGVAMSSLFAAGVQISQNRTAGNSTFAYPSNAQLAAAATGQQAAQLGQQITNRNLNVQPMIKIRPGYVFDVRVMKTIIFPGPYKPLDFGARKTSQ
jgi:type IV secretion system protein TrbI